MFVVRGLRNNLLGLPAIISLQLLYRVNSVDEGNDVRKRYPKVFSGLGNLGDDYIVKLKERAVPYALFTPRNVPIPLREKVREELTRMENMGVISVRICVDLKRLNYSVLREPHPIPKVDETLAQVAGAKMFSKLDANSRFWQIPLAKQSRPLTTFITPFGRYCFNKLAFGISSAPELFQRRMNLILEGLEGTLCHIDDVLVYGATRAEHDARLEAVIKRLEAAGVTLNSDKCEFRRDTVKFLGHVIDGEGIKADPEKTSAVLQMTAPTNVTELRRFLGMINQLGKFSPRISELSQPLRELLSMKRSWTWGNDQEQAFILLKRELAQPTVYSPKAPTKVSADASSYGLGAVLLQKVKEEWRPVAYASRSMTSTEKNYAQIEKEALAVTWSCDKFACYILGRHFEIETDHKPLVPLLSNKNLESLPPRILRFRLRLARYDYMIQHVPGKLLYTAGTLSRSPVAGVNSLLLQDEVESFIETVTDCLPASTNQLKVYKEAQDKDTTCSRVKEYCLSSWPKKERVELELIPYWKERSYFTLKDGLLLHGTRIVIPASLREETMDKIHTGHQGIERCRLRVRNSVWWPRVTQEMTEKIQHCPVCAKEAVPRKEPLMVSPLPDYPWQVIGTDLFELKGDTYLLVVDYFSRYPEIAKLISTTSPAVINVLKSIFARHGIPETLRSDNGPQDASQAFETFAQSYGFQHLTSSPHFPQSNGQAERTVQTVKRLLKRSSDPYLAFLHYRATPFPWCQRSPAELLMGGRLRTSIPQVKEQFDPQWPYLEEFKSLNRKFKQKQKRDFNKRHRAQNLKDIPEDTKVWVPSGSDKVEGRVVSPAKSPRSYLVDTPTGVVRRNRLHLNVAPQKQDGSEAVPNEHATERLRPNRIATRSQTGTLVKPPEKLYNLRGEMWQYD